MCSTERMSDIQSYGGLLLPVPFEEHWGNTDWGLLGRGLRAVPLPHMHALCSCHQLQVKEERIFLQQVVDIIASIYLAFFSLIGSISSSITWMIVKHNTDNSISHSNRDRKTVGLKGRKPWFEFWLCHVGDCFSGECSLTSLCCSSCEDNDYLPRILL